MSETQTAGGAVDNADKSMDDIMALCKRRGFIYPASEIYGGINGFWDYGPLGTYLKKNLRDAWWQDMVLNPPTGPEGEAVSIVPIDSCIIQNPKVWEASGHVGGFNDPMVDCKSCKSRFRADQLWILSWNSVSAFISAYKQIEEVHEEYGDAIQRLQSGNLSNAEYEEILQVGQYKVAQEKIVPYIKSVVASSREEALSLAQLSKKELKAIGDPAPPQARILSVYNDARSKLGNRLPPSCPMCLEQDTLTTPRAFNLMFKTYVGATASEDDVAYLRPETAQGIFINFKNVMDSTRVEPPFGIAQVGKAFRNEVTPRNFTFRSREFEQMEIEFFCSPEEAGKWYAFWRDARHAWWKSMGLSEGNLQLREHESDELAHYAKAGAGTCDIEYRFPFTAPGFGELEGVSDRAQFDLDAHTEASGAKMKYLDRTKGEIAKNGQPKGEWVTPNVIEPSAGLDRGVLALLCEAYTPDESRPSKVFMRFHPRVSPIKAAVFPLVNKDGMPEVAAKLAKELKRRFGVVEHDPKQNIGKRYARMDEAGCPFCFTIDSQTLSDQTVTVRDRDTAGQTRINLDQVASFLADQLASG